MNLLRLPLVAALLVAGLAADAHAQSALPAGFVYLRDVDPSIAQDIRYAGSNNFYGRPLPGYGAAECILTREAAAALKRVQADLAAGGLALKVYDCYRPARAVRAMVQWVRDGRPGNARFYPRTPKSALLNGYIAQRSRHPMGSTMDLTLVERSGPAAAAFDAGATYGSCIGPAAQRSPDNSLDMGTGYDCFDTMSFTASPDISPAQRQRRNQLVAAMRKHGFRNYPREWWHFTYNAGGSTTYDFPIEARSQ